MSPAGKPLDLAQFAGHTAGPWEANNEVTHYDIDAWDDIDGSTTTVAAVGYADARTGKNAALIAAAPSLLAECQRQREVIAELMAALEGMMTRYAWGGNEIDAPCIAARAALAKSWAQS